MKIRGYLAGAILGAALLTGCAQTQQADTAQEAAADDALTYTAGMYDSEDTALVVHKDTEALTIQFENLSTGKRYTLSYDGTATLLDRYGEALSLSQIDEGSIVTVRFYRENKRLASLQLTTDSMFFDELSNYTLDTSEGTITIGDTSYDLSNHLLIFSEGEEVELMDINSTDVLDVWGWHNQIYGINISRGHGYLRLVNDTYFVDGWIEVGQSIICKVTEDMLLTVPEGTATVTVSHNGTSAVQEIEFVRNQEMAWDLADVEIVEPQKGSIIFTVTPSNAQVTIDGENVDVSSVVELEYGVHQMTVTADGYDTVAQYIKVREESANISVELERSEESTEEAASAEDAEEETAAADSDTSESVAATSQEETTATTTSGDTTESTGSTYQVHIDSPSGVEVYVDGNYVGIAPVDFEKKAGNYVISLRKSGYQTRSYTLQIDSEDKDVTYSFSELVKVEE